MDLYLLRHGIAEDFSDTGHDRDRVLTEDGIEKTRAAGKALRKLEVEFDVIFASPFARAWQTAEIVAEQLDAQKALEPLPELGADCSAGRALEKLKNVTRKHRSPLVVGHEPILSELISLLISGSPQLAIAMKKGGLCKLSCVRPEPGGARLDWLLTSKHLCRMA
jgi:phosphohistidine phosphatase